QIMGEQMVEDYPDGAEIAILDFPSNESTVQRVEGFKDGLGDEISKFEVVAQQDGKATTDDSLPIAQDIIQSNPDIDAFFAINDPSALGVTSAIDDSGKDDIDVYSIDASPDGKEALLNGSFTAVSAQVPVEIAETAFESAEDYLDGKDIDNEILLDYFNVDKEEDEKILKMDIKIKNYGPFNVLKGINFEIIYGELQALLRENGAGKSTLIKILGGIHQPNEVKIFIDNKIVDIKGVQDAEENGIGI